jgi:hexulose-6-phosphate isomerase
MKNKIGYMQGRLVDQIDGKIQAFPEAQWRDEFPIAQRIGVQNMEWTLDDHGLEDNPLCTAQGQAEIRELSTQYGLVVASITGDCFMQSPFWKCEGSEQAVLLRKLDITIAAAGILGARIIVVPLVDNGSVDSPQQSRALHSLLMQRHATLQKLSVHIAFESDFEPKTLRDFIADFPTDSFGINYDIGNSASLGYDPEQEMAAYAARVTNIHVKDRKLGGTTVPLGTGAAQMKEVLNGLRDAQYGGNFILQTARAADGDHEAALHRYIAWTLEHLERHFES